MTDDLQSLTYKDVMSFRGAIRRGGMEIPVEALIVTRARHGHVARMTFELRYSQAVRDRIIGALYRREPALFEGNWVLNGTALVVTPWRARLLLRWHSESAGTILGEVEEMLLGEVSHPTIPQDQIVVASLTPTPIPFMVAIQRWHGVDGVMMGASFEEAREPFELFSSWGRLSLYRSVAYEKAQVGGVDAKVQVPVIHLEGKLSAEVRSSDCGALAMAVMDSMRDLTTVLSLLSRQHVECYRMQVLSSFGNEATMLEETELFRAAVASEATGRPLVVPRDMERDAIEVMVRHLAGTAYRQVIRNALDFALSYWRLSDPIGQVSAAFTALETLVNGISEARGESQILPADQFGRLRTVVEGAIRGWGEENDVSSEVRAKLYEKIGELQRPALTARAVALIEECEVEWADLWPSIIEGRPATLSRAIRSAYGLRSRLVHTGLVEEPQALMANAASVHAVTERLLFRFMGGRPAWIDDLAYHYAQEQYRWSR